MKTIHSSKAIIGIIGGHMNNTNKLALDLSEYTGEVIAKRGIALAWRLYLVLQVKRLADRYY